MQSLLSVFSTGRYIVIYVDNAATSYHKPAIVSEAVFTFLQQGSANPGRAGHHLANKNAMHLYKTRVAIARFFNAANPLSVVLTSGITASLNMLLKGYLQPEDEVLVSPLEHNAMMRPLRTLEKKGARITVLKCDAEGRIDIEKFKQQCSGNIKLVAVNHVSNVSGVVQPIKEVGGWCRTQGVPFLLDTAQSAGSMPIDMQECCIDMLAFTGHKGLKGPMGIGGFILGDTVNPRSIQPLIEGGTGSNSEVEEQPAFMPDRFESGTPNMPGVIGLCAALDFLMTKGLTDIVTQERGLTKRLVDGLSKLPKVQIVGHRSEHEYGAVVSFTIAGHDLGECATDLDREFGICCRAGLHCSPAAHRYLGTFPNGTIRLSISSSTTADEIDTIISAIASIVKSNEE